MGQEYLFFCATDQQKPSFSCLLTQVFYDTTIRVTSKNPYSMYVKFTGRLICRSLVMLFLAAQTACNGIQKASIPPEASVRPAAIAADKYNLDKIKLPPGFTISLFAEVPNARSMTFGTKGTLFVGNRRGDKVFAVVDKDKNGVAEKVYTIASGLTSPPLQISIASRCR
jgi:glucose/arabinose dehydrogenase